MEDGVVHERVISLEAPDGQVYGLVLVHAEPSAVGTTWEGWIEFVTELGQRVVTDRETTQSSKEAVVYWATGSSPSTSKERCSAPCASWSGTPDAHRRLRGGHRGRYLDRAPGRPARCGSGRHARRHQRRPARLRGPGRGCGRHRLPMCSAWSSGRPTSPPRPPTGSGRSSRGTWPACASPTRRSPFRTPRSRPRCSAPREWRSSALGVWGRSREAAGSPQCGGPGSARTA